VVIEDADQRIAYCGIAQFYCAAAYVMKRKPISVRISCLNSTQRRSQNEESVMAYRSRRWFGDIVQSHNRTIRSIVVRTEGG
jgi:hypothetical protein